MDKIQKKLIKTVETIYDTPLQEFMARYHNFVKYPNKFQEEFAKDVFNLIMNDTDTTVITAIAARCGIGKSKIIQSLISYCTQNINFNFRFSDCIGMIIITDALDRLDAYQNEATNLGECIWGDISDYNKHRQYCAYITSNNDKPVLDQLVESRFKPIVLLTTQRYFMMDDDLRELLFTFRLGKDIIKKREIVIFDEKPYFYNTTKIDVKNLALCYASLQNGIQSNDPDKDWILQEFSSFRNKLENILKTKEKCYDHADYFYWKDQSTHNITSNDKRFFELIDKHKIGLRKAYNKSIIDFYNFQYLMTQGGFFITQKKHKCQDYQTYFVIVQDNRDKFYLGKHKAKYFIFDATADIDTDYKRDYVNIIDFAHYNTELDVVIQQYDINTSKSKLCYNENNLNTLSQFIKQQNKNEFENILLATYTKIENSFNDNKIITNHFGNLKGLNCYNNIYSMAHVGLNRYSDFTYFIKYIMQNPNIFEQVKAMNEEQSRIFISNSMKMTKGLFDNEYMNEIMFLSIFVDFEQNLFRTAIRNYNNTKTVKICTYWNCRMYKKVNELIKSRYLPYNAKVEYMGIPPIFNKIKVIERKPTKNNELTNPQKIVKWYDKQPKGRIFKIAELLKETKISNDALKRSRKTNNYIHELFAKSKTYKKGYYKVS